MQVSKALQIFLDLRPRPGAPMHFDAFVHGDDEPGDAGRALRKAMRARGLGPDRATILEIAR